MKTNVKEKSVRPVAVTHEGAVARKFDNISTLRRTVLSCLLFEDTFYESGVDIAKRIGNLVEKCRPEEVSALAIEARTIFNMRHAPLLIVREMARLTDHKPYVAYTLATIIQRADELAEFLALYWKDGKCPISAQVKKGLAHAFTKFDEYALAKYNRDAKIKLRDVLFLVHAKPLDKKQEKLWKRLVDGSLATPDTWETELSAGKDKKETFTRLLKEKKLGALALLRNLRNMYESKVSKTAIFTALEEANLSRVLPMRFITAAKHAPQWEDKLEETLMKVLENRPKLSGSTSVLIDVSGSMTSGSVSERSELTPADVAASLAILVRELCKDVNIYIFGTNCKRVPARHGFALRDLIHGSEEIGYGTNIFQAVQFAHQDSKADRCIIITDCQSADNGRYLFPQNYVLNVANYQHSVGYGKNVVHIDGWSEAVLDYIQAYESL